MAFKRKVCNSHNIKLSQILHSAKQKQAGAKYFTNIENTCVFFIILR